MRKKMSILLVEDDQKIAEFVSQALRQSQFLVDCVETFDHALDHFSVGTYDLVICDLNLRGRDGLQLIEHFRKSRPGLPILIVSARHSVEDRVTGLEQGADDYLVKPFAISELIARVQALLRRSSSSFSSAKISVGDLTIDPLSQAVTRGDKTVELNQKEYQLLLLMARNAGRTLPKNIILEKIWGYHFDPQTNVLDVLVHRLRQKLSLDGGDSLVHTVRGVGYVLKSQIST